MYYGGCNIVGFMYNFNNVVMGNEYDLGLYVKTYGGDMGRFAVLLDSIARYNVGGLPLIVECEYGEEGNFKQLIGECLFHQEGLEFDVVVIEGPRYFEDGSLSQQVSKLAFGMRGFCDYYVVLDSDSYFVRSFDRSDFMREDDEPYLVMHEERGFFEWLSSFGGRELERRWGIKGSFARHCEKVKGVTGYKGLNWSFGPSPVVISSRVIRLMEGVYDMNFGQMVEKVPSEYTWYGYAYLQSGFPVYPREPLFKVFHYREQWEDMKERGIVSEGELSVDYMGIVMQSNWGAPLRY